jgi:hypothetical protein
MVSGEPPGHRFVPTYTEAFLRRCHEFVLLGYARLDPKTLVDLDETAITGYLTDAMEAALNARDAPEWCVHFTAIDDQPESVGGKTGKRRPRVDITVLCINPRPSTSFRFESKRLFDLSSLREYLGDNGMLALITGHYGDLRRAGMLGYVQSDSCGAWSTRIKEAIEADPPKYHAVSPVTFAVIGVRTPEPIFRSRHSGRSTPGMLITHTLLACA